MARNLRKNVDHGAIHKASEEIFRHKGDKATADVIRDAIKFPWLNKFVSSAYNKLKKIFPSKSTAPETEVALPFPKQLPPERGAALILWKNIPVDTYRTLYADATDKDSKFSVIFYFTFNLCISVSRWQKNIFPNFSTSNAIFLRKIN